VIVLIVLVGACVLAVPCIGVLSAIAIPSFIGYVRRSKVAEAEQNLELLGSAVHFECQQTGRLPGPAGPLPTFPTSERQVVDFGADPGFVAVGFEHVEPLYFSYAIEPDPMNDAVTLVARGDLDGDGVTSRFSRVCHGSCTCDSMVRENELE
jgi:type II secretory pathway pseudopilin PulG